MDLISRETVANELEKNKYSRDFCSEHMIDFSINMGMVRTTVASIPSAFEGMTNGEVVKAVFPSFTVEVNSDWVACWVNPHDTIGFDKDWWNAPYKEEKE